MVSGFERRVDEAGQGETKSAAKGNGVKGAKKKQHLRLDAEERKLARAVKEFYREHRNWLRPRSKAVVVSEAKLLAVGGVKKMVWHKNGLQSRITFGGEGETRLTFTPYSGAWKIELEGKPSLEELKRELCRSGCGLWDNDNQKPDIAFQAVDALLCCSRDWQEFIALSKSEQQKADVYFAMVNVHLAISATLQALKRDAKTKARRLQLAFKLLTDNQWQSQIGKLRHHLVMLTVELQRPPYKSELRKDFDPQQRIQTSNFATLLRNAGLGWLPKKPRTSVR
jgi:hypothetical protein